jgi:hypothetical protein
MELHLKITGILLIVLSLLHISFPGYFNWARELSGLSLVNRQMMYVHTFFIALVLILMGLLCLTSSAELEGTNLGRKICLGMAIFWIARLWTQFFGYSSKLWKKKKFETRIHILFSILWAYMSIIFAILSWN